MGEFTHSIEFLFDEEIQYNESDIKEIDGYIFTIGEGKETKEHYLVQFKEIKNAIPGGDKYIWDSILHASHVKIKEGYMKEQIKKYKKIEQQKL